MSATKSISFIGDFEVLCGKLRKPKAVPITYYPRLLQNEARVSPLQHLENTDGNPL
jgi:hypothetical protein